MHNWANSSNTYLTNTYKAVCFINSVHNLDTIIWYLIAKSVFEQAYFLFKK